MQLIERSIILDELRRLLDGCLRERGDGRYALGDRDDYPSIYVIDTWHVSDWYRPLSVEVTPRNCVVAGNFSGCDRVYIDHAEPDSLARAVAATGPLLDYYEANLTACKLKERNDDRRT